jgi:hypothetical protein
VIIQFAQEMTMKLFDYEAALPYPLETVFQHIVDLENAPRWHPYFYHVVQVTSGTIGLGTTWRKDFRYLGFSGTLYLEIAEWQPCQLVRFKGSRIATILPEFVIQFKAINAATHIHYFLQPNVPRLMQLPMALFAPIIGRRDLRHYFGELAQQIASASPKH